MAAYTAIDDSEAFFQVHLYTGTGSTNARTLGGDTDLQPDLVWVKKRSATQEWACADAARSGDNILYLNGNNSNDTTAGIIPSFQSDGFTVGSAGNGTGTNYTNTSSQTYVAYCWKGGTTSGITTNGSTTITPSAYSFNQTAGFSTLKYSGNATSGAKIAHGLGVAPELVFYKSTTGGFDWLVYSKALGATKELVLNDDAASTTSDVFNDEDPPTRPLGEFPDPPII